jgi:hypothetical protein
MASPPLPLPPPSPLLRLRSTAHAASFALRQALAWSRGQPSLQGGPWLSAVKHWSSIYSRERRQAMLARAESLVQGFGLDLYAGRLHGSQWAKNLYVLDLLLATVGPHLDSQEPAISESVIQAVDVGCADWDYVFALHAFLRGPFRSLGSEPTSAPTVDGAAPYGTHRCLRLTGLEIDPHGIYPDGYSRADYTRAYIAALETADLTSPSKGPRTQTTLLHEDALQAHLPQQDLVFCFFPFILPYQIVAWGLPLGLLNPQALLAKQAAWVKAGGLWVIYTHAEEEREPLRAHLATWLDVSTPNFELVHGGPARSLLEERPDDYDERWVWILRRKR